jgi:hypothetical protein
MIALVGGSVLLLVVLYVFRPTNKQSEESRKDEIGAKVACEELIKRDLKAPSTASFSGAGETRVEYLGGGTHTVRGWVHAQNSFGASLHSQYVCEVTRMGNESWQRETISLN